MLRRVREPAGSFDVWIVTADLFAGILLFVIMGIALLPRPVPVPASDQRELISQLKADLEESAKQAGRLREELGKRDERLREMEPQLQQALGEVRRTEERLREAERRLADATRQGKLSDIPPECPAQPLFDAIIVGDRRYRIEGKTYSFDEIQARYRKEFGEGLRTPCVHRVVARPSEGQSAQEYLAGLWPLEVLFYVIKRQ
jgi:hypothetical protein